MPLTNPPLNSRNLLFIAASVHLRWRTYVFNCEFCGKETKIVLDIVEFVGDEEPKELREPRLYEYMHCEKGQSKPTIPKIEVATDPPKGQSLRV
jgi:hypothetical protein